jgi:hypothetical protein
MTLHIDPQLLKVQQLLLPKAALLVLELLLRGLEVLENDLRADKEVIVELLRHLQDQGLTALMLELRE